jgi:hypothetical protein
MQIKEQKRRCEMITIFPLFRKIVLFVVITALGLAVLPVTGAAAAGLNDPAVLPPAGQQEYPRIERIWDREQKRYDRQGALLDKAVTLVTRVQALLDKAAQKGLDVSAIQAALDAFQQAIPAAQAAHEPGAVIIRTHSGFNANGEVQDRDKALETIRALQQVLKDTRIAMDGTGWALWQAIREWRQEHRGAATPTVTP